MSRSFKNVQFMLRITVQFSAESRKELIKSREMYTNRYSIHSIYKSGAMMRGWELFQTQIQEI